MRIMENILLTIVLAPLLGSIISGFWGGKIGRAGAHWVASGGVGLSVLLSLYVLKRQVLDGDSALDFTAYTWMVSEGMHFQIGFLVDRLSALMISVVTFVSFCVHIYTIGYMADDEHNWPKESLAGRNSYQRFFSYISLFTFAMLMLVLANNFLQLFFGWEAVGLMSYLLIGFWSVRESAIFANLKAFLVNRVGDFGFILGIALIAMYFGSLQYGEVFAKAPELAGIKIDIWGAQGWSLMSVICILLFIGAMGKSAQVPLHVWLPDSMEGPTPISALIHAATMVTAGIFMVARMSPLYELSETALSVVLVIGATTAFFTGLIGVVQNDIKRVIAYSTLSQLGYMTVALGASAYAAGIFHLMTHAFFKALLFLGAGSVILGMHHDQDIRNMGGVRKHMPVTWITFLLGSLALVGTPGFSGFFSKDAIIEAVHHSSLPGSGYAYFMVLTGVFVTALYTFRVFFLVFHGEGPRDHHAREHIHESSAVVTLPLVLLAIPSVVIGWLTAGPVLFQGFFGSAIKVLPEHDVLGEMGQHFHGSLEMVIHGSQGLPFGLALGGFFVAWLVYMIRPEVADFLKGRLAWVYQLLDKKYWVDELYFALFAAGGREIGKALWLGGDRILIDGVMVNGSAQAVGWVATLVRQVQTGYLFHYAAAMILGLLILLTGFVVL
jgi:NADH-quinone oxidoreductase subunit L